MNEEFSIKERIVLTIILVVLCISGLFDHSLWGPNDAREGTMIWEMQYRGRWVTPILNGEAYLEKPPLLHWTGVIIGKIVRSTQEGFLRLPAALYSFGAIWLMVLWGRRLGRERAGFAAAFMCLTAMQFFEYSKIVLTDTCVAFMVTLSLWLFWEAYSSQKMRAVKFFVFLLVSALSFYAKGLVGPALIWVPVGGFLLWKREWKLCFLLPTLYLPLLVIVVLPWAWHLYEAGGMEFIRGVFWDNQFGRFFVFGSPADNPHLPYDPYFVHKRGPLFYIQRLPFMVFPWTLILAAAIVWWCRGDKSPSTPFTVFLRCCLGGMWLVLHLSSAKVKCYALPAFPIMFFMAALWMDEALWDWENAGPLVKWCFGITAGALLVFGVLAAVGYVSISFIPDWIRHKYLVGMDLERDIGHLGMVETWGIAGVLAVFSLAGAWMLWRAWRSPYGGVMAMRFPAFVGVLYILIIAMAVPIYDAQRTVEPVAELIKSQQSGGRDVWLALKSEKHIGACIYYVGNPMRWEPFDSELASKIRASAKPVGVMVRLKDLQNFGREFGLHSFYVVTPDYPGYAARDFRMLLWDPISL